MYTKIYQGILENLICQITDKLICFAVIDEPYEKYIHTIFEPKRLIINKIIGINNIYVSKSVEVNGINHIYT